jgi:hypothetical protein
VLAGGAAGFRSNIISTDNTVSKFQNRAGNDQKNVVLFKGIESSALSESSL